MLFREGRFTPSGIAEYAKLVLTFLAVGAQVGLDIALSVLIGEGFRARAPWAFFLAIALAAAWAAGLLLLIGSFIRLVRFLNSNHATLKDARSALVLPLGAESLAAALGSAFLSGAVVWIAKTARSSPSGLSSADRYGQFDIYFPIAIGFQILALPGCIRLADIFSYAQSKAVREVENVTHRSDKQYRRKKIDLSSGSTHSPLISAESIRAAQKELDLAKARLERQERQLASTSTGASAQSIGLQQPASRPLVPMVDRPERKDREREDFAEPIPNASFWRRRESDRPLTGGRQSRGLRSGDSVDMPDTTIEIFNDPPARKGGGRLFSS